MHANTLFSVVWRTQYNFLALRHLVVCTKIFFLFFNFFLQFWKFWWKSGILISKLYFYGVNYRLILIKMARKIHRKICNILKQAFEIFLNGLGRTWPNYMSLAHISWLLCMSIVTSFSPLADVHCARLAWREKKWRPK